MEEPLAAAMARRNHDVVVHLLALGAVPRSPCIMADLASEWSVAVLAAAIAAGGDVNAGSWSQQRPVFAAARSAVDADAKVLLLLEQPALNLAGVEEHVRTWRGAGMAARVRDEVSADTVSVARWWDTLD